MQALRRYVRSGAIPPQRGAIGVASLAQLDVMRYGHAELFSRIWKVRDNLSAYAAAYNALAEALDAPLLTLDARLVSAPGHQAEVHLIQ